MLRESTLLIAALTLTTAAHAQVMSGSTGSTTIGTCSDRVQVAGFSIEPTQPTHNQQSTIRLKIKNSCGSSAYNVPWQISVGSTVIKSGVAQNLAANATVDVTAAWTAKIGTHQLDAVLDAGNTLNESVSARSNNLPNGISLSVNGDWNGWKSKVKAALSPAIENWFKPAALKDVVVVSPLAWDGRLDGPSMEQFLKAPLVNAGVPADIATAFALGIADRWSVWRGSVRVPNLPIYTHPVPIAMKTTVNIVTPPLATLQQNLPALSAPAVAQAIAARLGSYASANGASAALNEVGQAVNACFIKLGPVPVFGLQTYGTVAGSLETMMQGTFSGRANGVPGHLIVPPGLC